MIHYFIVFIILLTVFLAYKYYILVGKLKNKNKEFNSLQEYTKKKNHYNKEYISSLSHELRTPLYGIMGLTNILSDQYPELENNKNIKSLKFSSNYLLTLINNVLQVSVLESKDIVLDKKEFDLRGLAQNIVDSFSYATESSDNTLHIDFAPNIPETVVGNAAVLSQVLMNLISNALRFTRNGNITFSVHLINKKENTNTISFKVTHDGYQVSEEDENSIYQEFINIDHIKKSYLGTGIHSTITKRLAKLLNGEIIVQHDSGSGSEYAFILDLEAIPDNNKSLSTNKNKDERLNALIVDDNKLNLLVAEKILSKENFNCTTIDNGFDAIDLAKENSYNIILMDINMPKLNGIGTTKRIREFDDKTPIIALTAVDVTQLNKQIIKAGLNSYILKPYDKNVLLEMIQEHIEV